MNTFEKKITPGFLLKFTLPSVIMMVFNSFYTMVDGGFVSNMVGSTALSAVNISYPLISLVFAIGIMLASGGSAVVANFITICSVGAYAFSLLLAKPVVGLFNFRIYYTSNYDFTAVLKRRWHMAINSFGRSSSFICFCNIHVEV